MYIKNSSDNKIDFSIYDQVRTTIAGSSFDWRFLPIYILIIIIFAFLFFNLFNLQLIDGRDYLLIASRTNQTENRIVPPRGLVYDSKGKKLAYNVPSYTLFVSPLEIEDGKEKETIRKVSKLLDLKFEKLWQGFKEEAYEDGEILPIDRVTIQTGLDFDQYIDAVLVLNEMEGVYIEVEAVREYISPEYFSHIIGYVGDPTESDVENGIYSRSQIGKLGVEFKYDQYLRGTEGVEITETGIIDHRQRTFIPQEEQPGDNIYLTIDKKWQLKLSDIMQRQIDEVNAFAGAGVVMDSDTGEIKAMVSLPSFDNNLFSQGISSRDFTELLNDPKTPLLNRVVGLQLPPGSIFKIIGATAALETNTVNQYTEILSDRCLELPGDIQFCEADGAYLGSLNIKSALAKSSNIYFCSVALKLPNGIRDLEKYAADYGIGQTTGIDLNGEQLGTMASPELKEKLWSEQWYLGDICNAIVGQGLVTVTPLQMVVAMSAVNNGGEILKPRLVSKIEDQTGNEKVKTKKDVVRKLDVSAENLEIIKDGMRQAATDGTAADLDSLPGDIFAKTGSADASELIQGKLYTGAHSWVMGCFDSDGKNYCFVIMQQWGGRGYKTVPIIKKFINCVYNDFADSCEEI